MDRKRIGKTFFIPASGYRNVSSSQVNTVSSYGFYSSSAPSSATGGYGLYFYSTQVFPQRTYNRLDAFSVRPVQE